MDKKITKRATNVFKRFVNKIITDFSEIREISFAKKTARQQKRIARNITVKELRKHYRKMGIKHFGTFSTIKPLNW